MVQRRSNGWVVWITGLPGSGKSTVTQLLARSLLKRSITCTILSSDSLRKVVTPEPLYTEEERHMLYDILVAVAKKMSDHGVNVIIDATGNRRKYRNRARILMKRFVEVFLDCDKNLAIRRERRRKSTHSAPRAIYAKAKAGRAPTVPGMGSPYEEPLNPELIVDSSSLSVSQCEKKILRYLLLKFPNQASR